MPRFKVIDVEFWIEISDSDFVIGDVNEQGRHLNYNNSNNSELCWISTSESWIITNFLKLKSSAIAFSFAWFFFF